MLLYLVRHGIAVDPNDPKSPPEPERPLTAKGVQKTRAAALGLQALGVKPDVLLSSPYVRAANRRNFRRDARVRPAENSRARRSEACRQSRGHPQGSNPPARQGSNVLRPR